MAKKGGKHRSGLYRVRIRSLLVLFAMALLLGAGVSATIAMLVDRTAPTENVFEPGKVTCQVVEDFLQQGGVYNKRNVKIRNTGNTDAYIRVRLVFTWKDAQGNVYANRPLENRDFNANLDLYNGWIAVQENIGSYFYYKYPVAPGADTKVLIDSIRKENGAKVPAGYDLSVEVVADAVQALPASAVVDAWDEVAVDENGVLTIRGGIGYDNNTETTEPTE